MNTTQKKYYTRADSFRALRDHRLDGTLLYNFANNIKIAKRMTNVNDIYYGVPHWVMVYTNIVDGDYEDADGYYAEDQAVYDALHEWISEKWSDYFNGHKNWKLASKEIEFGEDYELPFVATDLYDPDTMEPVRGIQKYFVAVSWDENGRLYFWTWSDFSEEGELEEEFKKRCLEWKKDKE